MTKQQQDDQNNKKNDKNDQMKKVDKKSKILDDCDSDDELIYHMNQMHQDKQQKKIEQQKKKEIPQQSNALNPPANKSSQNYQQPQTSSIPPILKPNPPTSAQTIKTEQIPTQKSEAKLLSNQNNKFSNNIFEAIGKKNTDSQSNVKTNQTKINISQNLPKKQELKNEEKSKREQGVKTQEETKKQQGLPGQLRDLHLDPQILSSKLFKITPRKRLITKLPFNQSPFFKNQQITVMSWNVWKQSQHLNPSNKDSRYREIIDVIKKKNPNIVCLQEAEQFRLTYLAEFLQTDGKHYNYSNSSPFSTIILTRMKVDFYQVKFPKEFKTKPMTLCQFQMMGSDGKMRSVIVHSVHLKMRAEDTSSTRRFQLQVIDQISKKHDIVIMAGDYNIGDQDADNRMLKYKHLDLQLHNKNPKVDEQEETEEEGKREYKPRRNQLNRQYMEEYVQEVVHEEQIIEYEFDSDQDSFDGYSDSWYDSDGNPYESSSEDSYQGSSDDQFGYSEDRSDQDGSSNQDGSNPDAMDDEPSYYQDHHQDQFQSGPSDQEDDSHVYDSHDNSWDDGSRGDYDSYDQMEQGFRQKPRLGSYYQHECHLRGGGGGRRGYDSHDSRKRRPERQRSRERHPIRVTKTKTTYKTINKIMKKQSKQSFSDEKPQKMSRKQSSKSKSNRKPPTEFPEQQPEDMWTYMYYPKKNYHRFDRILISHRNMTKQDLRKKVNVKDFERLGKYCVGRRYEGDDYRMYFHDKRVRTPSDHLGVLASFWLNFHNKY